MKTAYFDCFSGVSGDMLIGSLLDVGLDFKELKGEIAKLGITGYKISKRKVERGGITGTAFRVDLCRGAKKRNLEDILKIIKKSKLDNDIKLAARKIFEDIARVEGKIHNKPRAEIHFHELGGTDCMIDIAGALAGLKILGIRKVYSSPINLGRGFVKCAHGTLPVPSPATVELLKGLPVYSTGVNSELATPTGVAIMKNVSAGFGAFPSMRVEGAGYGAGAGKLEIPNMLRVVTGETCADGCTEDEVILIETNIDNMNPEFYDYVMETLLKGGALDVYLTPVIMKKNRPGTKLSVIAGGEKLDRMVELLFRETTTLGVRFQPLRRRKLERRIEKVDTRFGRVRVKVAGAGGKTLNVSPEYDDCRRTALKHGVPLREVYEEAKKTQGKHSADSGGGK